MSSYNVNFNQAKRLHALGKIKEAQKLYEITIKNKNDDYLIFSLLATTYLQLKDYNKAIKTFTKSINLNPKYPESFNNRGIAYAEIQNYKLAIKDYNEAINLNKNYFSPHLNKGIALKNSQKFSQAIDCFKICIKINPKDPNIYNNLGNLYVKLKKNNEAYIAFEKAIILKNNFALAYSNRGDLNFSLKKYDLALNDYSNALKINNLLDYVYGKYINTKMYINEWDNFDINVEKLIDGIKKNKKIINPFYSLYLIDSPILHKQVAQQYSNIKCRKKIKSPPRLITGRKIKLGYFSADFKHHAVSHLMIDVFKNHDKSKFEINGFNHSTRRDEMTEIVSEYFDKFFDCSNLSDEEIANLSKRNKIDIAIDLTGHTADSRTGIYQYEPAPIIINYLGYPGTMGSNCYDFIIADEIILPKKEKKNFIENIIYLPKCYQPKQNKIITKNKNFSKKDVGLPENTFIFASLNNNYKITPIIYDAWMEILKKTENSVLWLLVDDVLAEKNIKRETINRGVDIDRIIFASRVSYNEHLKRMKFIDLFLDTFPYGAHTTAKEAIRMGIPLITIMGKSFASRVASSILNDIGLEKLITKNNKDYINLAVKLRKDHNKLSKIKDFLNKSDTINKIHNSEEFTKDLEKIYIKTLKPVYS